MMAAIPAGATLVDRLLEDITTGNAESGKNTDAELFWLRTRLDDRRRERQRTATVCSVTSTKRQRHGTLLEKIMRTSEAACEKDSKNTTQGVHRAYQNMNVLQLRRFLRTLGQPTPGLKPMLVARVEAAVSSGVLMSFIEGVKSKSGVNECARDRRRVAEAMAIAQALLSPAQESEASETNGKGQQLTGPDLPGPEAVVTKMCSAPELLKLAANKLPIQGRSPPVSKTAGLKIELEARLEKQKIFKRSNTMPERSSSVKAAAAAASTTPSSRRPQATFDASASPAPSLGRARCMTDTRPGGRIADNSSKFCRTSSSSRATPGALSSKASMAALNSSVLISPKSLPRALGFNAVERGQGSRNGFSKEKDTGTASSTRDLGSPASHRLSPAKAVPRKVNRIHANQSIESHPRSPLITAAHRALDRVAKPEADASSSSPGTGCTTQSAFAKFRALDAAGKVPPAVRYKAKNHLKNKDGGDSGGAKSKAEPIPPRANLVRQPSKEQNHAHCPKDTANHSIPNEETLSEKAAPTKKAKESPNSVGAHATAPRGSGAAHQARMPVSCTPPRPPTKVPRDSPRPGSQARVPPLPTTPRPPLQSKPPAPPSSSPCTAPSSTSSVTSPARVAAALVSAVASASRGVSILNNSAHKAALEKKKLEIAKRLQTSPARIKPATVTPTTVLGPPPPSPTSTASLNIPEVASPSSAPVAVPYSIPTATPFQVLALSQPVASAKPRSLVQAAGPQLGPLPALVPIAGGGSKEERESYDDYEVEHGSSSESGGEEDEPQQIAQPPGSTDKSKIPTWARGKALGRILDKQFRRRNPVNPDKIFPEFFTCDLEHIFNAKKKKWDRTSSGNWQADRLTVAEKLAYQRAMGWA